MASFQSVLTSFNSLGQGWSRVVTDDDLPDRFNHIFMAGVFLTLSGFSGIKQLVGNPINCWPPSEYSEKRYFKYVNNVCWVSKMYYIPTDQPIPRDQEDRYTNVPSFYRWAMVFFLLQAAMFKLPHFVWGYARTMTGSNLDKIINMTLDTAMLDRKDGDEKMARVAEFIHQWTRTRGEIPSSSRRDSDNSKRLLTSRSKRHSITHSKRSGRQLVFLYLLIKSLYVANCIGQLFFVSFFLDLDFHSFGISAIKSYATTSQWEDEIHFPRVTLCDMYIRQQTNVLTFTVQCVLPMNLFLEKMFLFAWFSLTIAEIVSVITFISWIFWVVSDNVSSNFMKQYARILFHEHHLSTKNKRILKNVVENYLRPDGVFILRLVAHNTDEIVTSVLVRQIISRYEKALREEVDKEGDHGGNLLVNDNENHKEDRQRNSDSPNKEGQISWKGNHVSGNKSVGGELKL